MARRRAAPRLIVQPRYEEDRRAILGARVSEGRDRGHARISEDIQSRLTGGLAQAKGLVVVDTYQEIGISGDAEREALENAIRMIERGEAAWLVIHEVDRLGRDVLDVIDTMERIIAAGGCLLVVEPLLDSSSDAGQLIITILAQLAKSQRLKITKKWSHAQEHAWRVGKYPGDLPFGLRNPTDGELLTPEPGHPTLILVPQEAALIRQVAAMLIADGISWPMAARVIGRSASNTRALFANRAMLGEVAFGGRLAIDAHEPILTVTQFEEINGRRTTSMTARNNKPKYLGAGTLRCAGCRHTLHHRTAGKGERTYYCRNPRCQSPVRNVKALEAEARLEGIAFEAHRETLALMFEGESEGVRTIADVDTELNELRTRVRKFALLLAEDPDDEDMREARNGLKAQIASLEGERAALEGALTSKRAGFAFPELWASMEAWERIEAIRSVLDVVFVFGDGAMDAFFAGTYALELPSKGRQVPLAPHVPAQVRATA